MFTGCPCQAAFLRGGSDVACGVMRYLLKFLHTTGAIGMMGAMACLGVMLVFLPPPTALAEYAAVRGAMASAATWIFMPSLGVTLVAGLLAIAASPTFHNAGWAWVKAASGILLFESGFVGVLGPMQREATNSAKAMTGQFDQAMLGVSLGAETMTIWILLAVATANVVLGVWRPRLIRRRETGTGTSERHQRQRLRCSNWSARRSLCQMKVSRPSWMSWTRQQNQSQKWWNC
jgi:uncharacterized membrane protein